jgi:hypothetical protein
MRHFFFSFAPFIAKLDDASFLLLGGLSREKFLIRRPKQDGKKKVNVRAT